MHRFSTLSEVSHARRALIASASSALPEDRMRGRASAATIITITAPVIAAIAKIEEIITAVVIASQATNQTIIPALAASEFTSLVAREPAVRTEIAPLLANYLPPLAQESRLIACNLSRVNAAPDTLAITTNTTATVTALRQRHVRDAHKHTNRAQKKKPFHLYNPFL
jgi:hypothetical protein